MTAWWKLISGPIGRNPQKPKNLEGPRRLTPIIRELFAAQEGNCFCCGRPMTLEGEESRWRNQGWSREHVLPKARLKQRVPNNIVLSHPGCNSARGAPEPTRDEMRRARAIYQRIGRVAFTHRPPPPAPRTKPKMRLTVTADGVQWVAA